MDFELEKIDDISFPRQRPWLIVVVVVVAVAAVAIVAYHLRSCRHSVSPPAVPVSEQETKGLDLSAEQQVVSPRAMEPAVEEKKKQPAAEEPITADAARKLLEDGRGCEIRKDLLGAREAYLAILRRNADGKICSEAEKRLGKVNMELLLSPRPMPEKVSYKVQAGDSVEKIARKFGSTPELVAQSNGIRDAGLIKVGDELRVFNGKFSISVSRSRHDLVLFMNGEFCKRYSVGTGAHDKTPRGSFTVTCKEKNPVWWRRNTDPVPFGDKENILGTRWLAIKDAEHPKEDRRGIGIHGTTDESSIGKSVSAGCIRMINRDVEELDMLIPIGTPVRITE